MFRIYIFAIIVLFGCKTREASVRSTLGSESSASLKFVDDLINFLDEELRAPIKLLRSEYELNYRSRSFGKYFNSGKPSETLVALSKSSGKSYIPSAGYGSHSSAGKRVDMIAVAPKRCQFHASGRGFGRPSKSSGYEIELIESPFIPTNSIQRKPAVDPCLVVFSPDTLASRDDVDVPFLMSGQSIWVAVDYCLIDGSGKCDSQPIAQYIQTSDADRLSHRLRLVKPIPENFRLAASYLPLNDRNDEWRSKISWPKGSRNWIHPGDNPAVISNLNQYLNNYISKHPKSAMTNFLEEFLVGDCDMVALANAQANKDAFGNALIAIGTRTDVTSFVSGNFSDHAWNLFVDSEGEAVIGVDWTPDVNPRFEEYADDALFEWIQGNQESFDSSEGTHLPFRLRLEWIDRRVFRWKPPKENLLPDDLKGQKYNTEMVRIVNPGTDQKGRFVLREDFLQDGLIGPEGRGTLKDDEVRWKWRSFKARRGFGFNAATQMKVSPKLNTASIRAINDYRVRKLAVLVLTEADLINLPEAYSNPSTRGDCESLVTGRLVGQAISGYLSWRLFIEDNDVVRCTFVHNTGYKDGNWEVSRTWSAAKLVEYISRFTELQRSYLIEGTLVATLPPN